MSKLKETCRKVKDALIAYWDTFCVGVILIYDGLKRALEVDAKSPKKGE